MKINEKILDVFKDYNINPDDGICYLLSVYYGYKPTYIPDEFKQKMNVSKIVEIKGKDIVWNISLFLEQETSFDWVKTKYCSLFIEHTGNSGYYTESVRRMKKFFAEYPQYRMDDVINATKLYLNNTEPKYTRRPHYFIEKGKGVEKQSDLLTWIDNYKTLYYNSSGKKGITNTLQ